VHARRPVTVPQARLFCYSFLTAALLVSVAETEENPGGWEHCTIEISPDKKKFRMFTDEVRRAVESFVSATTGCGC